VGQTGVKVAPNLLYAVGISGAYSTSLRVVNSSKCNRGNQLKTLRRPFLRLAITVLLWTHLRLILKLNEALKA